MSHVACLKRPPERQKSGRVSDSSFEVVGHDDFCVAVPRMAMEVFDYPLVAIGHTEVYVPRTKAVPLLREILMHEYQGARAWEMVWFTARQEYPELFEKFTVMLLPQASNAIPAGNFVFKVERGAAEVEWSDVYHLTDHQRSQVLEAVDEGFEEFPPQRYVHCLLRPVFADAGASESGKQVLASPHEFMARVEEIKTSLHWACRRHRWRHWLRSKKWRERKRQVFRLERELLRIEPKDRAWFLKNAEMRGRLRPSDARRLAMRFEMLRLYESIEMIDPIWAVIEPSWFHRQYHSRHVTVHGAKRCEFFRRVVHWVDSERSVVTLPSFAEEEMFAH